MGEDDNKVLPSQTQLVRARPNERNMIKRGVLRATPLYHDPSFVKRASLDDVYGDGVHEENAMVLPCSSPMLLALDDLDDIDIDSIFD